MERRRGANPSEGLPRAARAVRPLEQIRQLQAQRVWKGKDLSIAKVVGELTKNVRRDATARGKAQAALAQAQDPASGGGGLPAEIAPLVRVGALARGVLTLIARDASSKYRAAQWLRAGGEARLLAGGALVQGGGKGGGSIRRVRVVLEGEETPARGGPTKIAGGGKGGGA